MTTATRPQCASCIAEQTSPSDWRACPLTCLSRAVQIWPRCSLKGVHRRVGVENPRREVRCLCKGTGRPRASKRCWEAPAPGQSGSGPASADPPAASLVRGHEVSRSYRHLSLALTQVTKGEQTFCHLSLHAALSSAHALPSSPITKRKLASASVRTDGRWWCRIVCTRSPGGSEDFYGTKPETLEPSELPKYEEGVS